MSVYGVRIHLGENYNVVNSDYYTNVSSLITSARYAESEPMKTLHIIQLAIRDVRPHDIATIFFL